MAAAPSRVATFHGVLRGGGVLRLLPGGRAVALAEGDLMVICHGMAHSIADAETSPTVPIEQALASAGGARLLQVGGSGAPSTILCGCFFADRRDGPPLFSMLPPLLHLRAPHAGGAPAALLELLAAEADRPRAGADAAISRLTEALFVHVLRAWIDAEGARRAPRLLALSDRQMATALGHLHRAPHTGWTVGALAREVGMSRSAFAARFADLVGDTPLRYLTRLRVHLAARQLQETRRSVAEIASQVGYDSEAALNKAFKRLLGQPPGAYRRGEGMARAAEGAAGAL